MEIKDILTTRLGEPMAWSPKSGEACSVWFLGEQRCELVLCESNISDAQLKRLVDSRQANRATPVVTVNPAQTGGLLRVAGPLAPLVVRELNAEKVADVLVDARQKPGQQASPFLEREFRRLSDSVVPGVRVKDLLTPYYVKERLLNGGQHGDFLRIAAKDVAKAGTRRNWRNIVTKLGYEIRPLPNRGHLLRSDGAPVAVIHPKSRKEEFGRMDDQGQLPGGQLLIDCKQHGAAWGIMACEQRFRLFQVNPDVGSAAARHIEIDLDETSTEHRIAIGMLAPEALGRDGGRFETEWIREARDFGEELRKGLEGRLTDTVLPALAKGLGRHLEQSQHSDLSDREVLTQIEEAVLTLVFRFMFLLHVEARGYLPMSSSRYREHSATNLASECRGDSWEFDPKSTLRWDRLRTLVRAIRNGDSNAGVPQYNGSLFAEDGVPGSSLLESADVADHYLAPALYAIAYDPEKPAAGLDYAALQIGHLGAIYESLLARRLVRAKEPLVYDRKKDVFRPCNKDEKPEVIAGELFYQNELGGRKSGGVYYTRHEFVRHLLNHSLIPALEEHFDEVTKLSHKDERKAADRLFDFHVLDPAMGSGHFLTVALDMMGDRFDQFLAERGGLTPVRDELDKLRESQSPNSPLVEDVDLLRRLILKRCVYGVDLSPLAVEIANVTLWLASFVPGLALSYLGSNLKCGDSLIGVAGPGLVFKGADSTLFEMPYRKAIDKATELSQELIAIGDTTADEVEASRTIHETYLEATDGIRRAFDLWTSDPLGVKGARDGLLLNAEQVVDGERWRTSELDGLLEEARTCAGEFRFMHWTLEFPHVFRRDNPGFDVVVGNPPWKKVKIEKHSFYALRSPGLRGIVDPQGQRARMHQLEEEIPELRSEYDSITKLTEAKRRFFGVGGGYDAHSGGDKDLFGLFCMRYSWLTRDAGRIGVVLPGGAFVNKGLSGFRKWLFTANANIRLDTILNIDKWAFPTHGQYLMGLLVAMKGISADSSDILVTGPSRNLREFRNSAESDGLGVGAMMLTDDFQIPRVRDLNFSNVLNKIRDSGSRFENLGVEF